MKPIYIFFIISRSVLLRMRSVSDKSCRQNPNTHFVIKNAVIENRALYERMWENIVERSRQQMTIWRMFISRWVHFRNK